MMAKRAKYQPKEDLAATGKGTCSRAPMTPLRTKGTVQQRLPKMMQTMASRLSTVKPRNRQQLRVTYQVNPTARIDDGASQL